MKEQDLKFLKQISRTWRHLESPDKRAKMRDITTNYVEDFLGRLSNPDLKPELDRPQRSMDLSDMMVMGEHPYDMEKLLAIYDEQVVCDGMHLCQGTYFGLIPNSGNYIYSLAEHIGEVTHVLSVARFINSGACDIEYCVVRWVADIVGFPEKARGTIVSGTSMGAIIAFETARDVFLDSPAEYARAVVYMTNQAHSSAQRALNVVGLKHCVRRIVPFDKQYRMDADALHKMVDEDEKAGLNPFMVIATMGSTNLGAVDPFHEIDAVAKKYEMWFHVDAAYGGFFLLCDSIKDQYKGAEMADSITLDFHKGMSTPFGTSVMLVRNGTHLKYAMDMGDVPYLRSTETGAMGYSPVDYTYEFTRPFRGFPIWFSLKTLGTKVIKDHMKEKLMLAEYVYEQLSKIPNVQMCMKPQLSCVAFRYVATDGIGENDATHMWLKLINEERIAYLTPTTIDGVYYIRFCILSVRSHIEEVELALDIIEGKITLMRKKMGIVEQDSIN